LPIPFGLLISELFFVILVPPPYFRLLPGTICLTLLCPGVQSYRYVREYHFFLKKDFVLIWHILWYSNIFPWYGDLCLHLGLLFYYFYCMFCSLNFLFQFCMSVVFVVFVFCAEFILATLVVEPEILYRATELLLLLK
jgi:hypothetical protein